MAAFVVATLTTLTNSTSVESELLIVNHQVLAVDEGIVEKIEQVVAADRSEAIAAGQAYQTMSLFCIQRVLKM